MEESHQKVIEELQRKHQRELENLQEEKERLLEEETAATIAGTPPAVKLAQRGDEAGLKTLMQRFVSAQLLKP